MNKIALFTISPFSLTSLLIAAVTRCPFSHAAICVGGVWYHASESTGKFSKVDISKFKDRHCTVYQFDGDLESWLPQMMNKEYDWKGVFGWAKRLVGLKYTSNDRKFYCFEAAISALLSARLLKVIEVQSSASSVLKQSFDASHLAQIDKAVANLYEKSFPSSIGLMLPGEGLRASKNVASPREQKLYIDGLINLITANPVTGCMVAELFPVGRTGRFGDLS